MNLRAPAAVLVLLALGVSLTAAQAPSTDIFILSVDGESVGEPRRITDREGYDNQPQFLTDGQGLVYSSLGTDGTDIYRHDLGSGETHVVVNTPESEYSPTPIPGRRRQASREW